MWREVLDGVVDIAMAATDRVLLRDVESLAEGLGAAGWVRGLQGGRWRWASDASWDARSVGVDPALSLFFFGSAENVYPAAQDLVARFKARGLRRQGVDASWMTWTGRGCPVSPTSGYHSDWVLWNGRHAALSLNVRPVDRADPHPLPVYLNLRIERTDVLPASTGLMSVDAGLVAREGSDLARWYLAGDPSLSPVLLNLLRRDPDAAVAAAARAEVRRRQSSR